MKITEIVGNGNMAHFSHFCGGNLYYTVDVNGSTYQFYINTDPKDVGTGDFYADMKAVTLMKWINMCMKSEEFIKIK
jgi:hypothetical protein